MGDVKKSLGRNSSKNVIIKTLAENLNTITNSLYKSPDKNIDKSHECEHSHGDEFKIPKNTVTIDSHYRNKFVEKEIPTPKIYDCLNIDKDVDLIKSDQVSRSHQTLPYKRHQIVVNNYSDNLKSFSRLPILPGKDRTVKQ